VKKLIGVKRKIIDGPPGGDRKMSSSWIQEHEEWESTEGDESEDEGESEEEEEEEMMTESPPESRPSTPVPAYLPMGPALLSTRFKHALLLPLSTPLRPPGAAVAPTSIATTAGPTSVPTPVSPAAAMGAASEKSKSLEGAAGMVAIEVVENGVWADAWRACAVGATAASRNVGEVWQKDIKTVKQLLAGVGALDGLEDMFRLGACALFRGRLGT
jgi:mediator of RNA polymerase II transcription subunit 13